MGARAPEVQAGGHVTCRGWTPPAASCSSSSTATAASTTPAEDRLQRFRNVEPERRAAGGADPGDAGQAAAIGTSNGYSTIWLAERARAPGVEADASRTALARENLARAGLAVELRTEDAAVTLGEAHDGAWDFVFLDAERPAYVEPRAGARRTGCSRSTTCRTGDQLVEFTALVEAIPRVTTTVVPIGAGLELIVREP